MLRIRAFVPRQACGVPRIPVGYACTLEEALRVRPAAIVAAALELLK